VPDDLSWIGFDGPYIAQIYRPRLTLALQPGGLSVKPPPA
jgi:DNA-binding LacI/PurR family transcriptional regulator